MNFKDLMSLIPTSVSVLSCIVSKDIYGCTISSVVSVNIDESKPEILFVLKKDSKIAQLISDYKFFTINLLADSQVDMAKKYSSFRIPDSVTDSSWRVEDNFADLKESRLNIRCAFLNKYDSHASDNFIGTVISYSETSSSKALIYNHRIYGNFGPV